MLIARRGASFSFFYFATLRPGRIKEVALGGDVYHPFFVCLFNGGVLLTSINSRRNRGREQGLNKKASEIGEGLGIDEVLRNFKVLVLQHVKTNVRQH